MSNMKYYDWKSNIQMNIRLMRIMGLWPSGTSSYKPGFYMIYALLMTIFLIVGHISTQIINIYFVKDNLDAVVGIIYIILIEILGAFKAYYLVKNLKVVKNNVLTFESEWFQPKNDHQQLLIEPSIKSWRNLYKSFLVMAFCCNTFWLTYPLLDASVEEKPLPFLAWYPYNYKVSPFYEMTYVFQIISVNYLSLIHLNVDTVISGFNVYTACQFDLLCDSIRNFNSTNGEDFSDLSKNLVNCVIRHKQILEFSEACRKFFNWILFWHLIFSGVSIGITMFLLTLVVPFSNRFYSLFSYGSGITIQIFMYCWFGNEVAVKSDLVSYAIFESEWTHLPENIKQILLIFMMNTLKPLKLSVLNVFELSVDTFMKILKTAWSYFALLYQLSLRSEE